MAKDILEGLNPRQRQAVEAVEGPLLIIAGPGSGKTRVITHRIAYLVRVCGVSPRRIAAVTFTNKAAREMRQRLGALLGRDVEDVAAGTFHAFCARVLRRDGGPLGLDSAFTIYDEADQLGVMKRAMGDAGVDPKSFAPGRVLAAISQAKSQLLTAHGFGLRRQSYFDEIVHRLFERYDTLLGAASAVDFDDLLLKTYLLFESAPDVAERYRERFVHFMIDEFQDTNVAQYAIARQIAGGHGNICVVGDPDQSIYSWRNADIRNILSFQRDFPGAKMITLDENYRSSQTILDAAAQLIKPNEQRVERNLWTSNPRGVPIVVQEGYDEREEAQLVVGEIRSLVRDEGCAPGDIAVMYRVNAQSRVLEEACLRYGLPYQIVGGLRFYHRQEIKDLAAYLRLVSNPGDDMAFTRIINTPPRGIGHRTLDEVARVARGSGTSLFASLEEATASADSAEGAHAPLAARSRRALGQFRAVIAGLAEDSRRLGLVEFIDQVLEQTGYRRYVQEVVERGEERWENLQEFRNSARDYAHLGVRDGLATFLESVSLVSDVDAYESKASAITLITLHQAKGLEFPVVFIVGMEEGLLPHARSMDSPEALEEERRLCYVGMTRAKARLYLMRAFRRGFRGTREPGDPSRFLGDIPKEFIASSRSAPPRAGRTARSARDGQKETLTPSGPVRREPHPRQAQPAQAAANPPQARSRPEFGTGDRVRHAVFGEGIVVSHKPLGADTELTVAFGDGLGVKRLLLSFAPIEKVG